MVSDTVMVVDIAPIQILKTCASLPVALGFQRSRSISIEVPSLGAYQTYWTLSAEQRSWHGEPPAPDMWCHAEGADGRPAYAYRLSTQINDALGKHDNEKGFRPVFSGTAMQPLLNKVRHGESTVIGTLYMNEQPLKVGETVEDIPCYIPGATISLWPALPEKQYQVSAMRIGQVFIANMPLLRNISRLDIEVISTADPIVYDGRELDIGPPRMPTIEEWEKLCELVPLMQLNAYGVKTWAVGSGDSFYAAICGGEQPDSVTVQPKTAIKADIGFRPTFDIDPNDPKFSRILDGDTVRIGTLVDSERHTIMPGPNVNPASHIKEYQDTDKELSVARHLANTNGAMTVIRVGNALIADHVMLTNLSFNTLEALTKKWARTAMQRHLDDYVGCFAKDTGGALWSIQSVIGGNISLHQKETNAFTMVSLEDFILGYQSDILDENFLNPLYHCEPF